MKYWEETRNTKRSLPRRKIQSALSFMVKGPAGVDTWMHLYAKVARSYNTVPESNVLCS